MDVEIYSGVLISPLEPQSMGVATRAVLYTLLKEA